MWAERVPRGVVNDEGVPRWDVKDEAVSIGELEEEEIVIDNLKESFQWVKDWDSPHRRTEGERSLYEGAEEGLSSFSQHKGGRSL